MQLNQIIDIIADHAVLDANYLNADSELATHLDSLDIRDGRVIVRDLKYGQGVLVEAENNAQLAIYALSFIRANEDIYDFPPDTIVDIGIVQPRHHADDPVRTWEVSLHDLEHGFEV